MASPPGSVEPIKYGWLVRQIQRGNVVPVIGPELYDDAQVRIADELWAKLELPPGERKTVDTRAIGLRNLDHGGHDHQFRTELAEVTRSALTAPPRALVDLARITDFPLYVTITHDQQLETALQDRRPVIRNYLRKASLELPDTRPDAAGKLPASPTIVHLFGRSVVAKDGQLPPFAATEAEVIEYLSALLLRDSRPESLFHELSGRVLLFLGCGLPDWLARFFIRVLTDREFKTDKPDHTRVVADDDIGARGDLAMFLRHHGVVMPPDGGAAGFVATLYQHWDKAPRGGPAPAPAPAPGASAAAKHVLFSVADADREAVAPIVSALQALKLPIPVWFDEADDAVTDQRIQHALLFVPFVSATTVANAAAGHPAPREWDLAIAQSNNIRAGDRYIVPVALDDVWPPAPDVFVLYAPVDAPFVQRELVPGLAPARILLSSALPPGKPVLKALEDAVLDSAVTVAVMTRAFVRDTWKTWGGDLALFAARTRGSFVALVLEDCDLPLRIQALVELDCRDPEARAEPIGRLHDAVEKAAARVAARNVRRGPQTPDFPEAFQALDWYRLTDPATRPAFVEYLRELYKARMARR